MRQGTRRGGIKIEIEIPYPQTLAEVTWDSLKGYKNMTEASVQPMHQWSARAKAPTPKQRELGGGRVFRLSARPTHAPTQTVSRGSRQKRGGKKKDEERFSVEMRREFKYR